VSAHEQERLSAWLDGELNPAERAEVDAHLLECEACATFLARLRAVDEGARALPTSVPEGYFDRLPARVRARIEARRRAAGRLPVWAWAAAAALLLAVVAPLTLRELRSPQAGDRRRAGGALPAPDHHARDALARARSLGVRETTAHTGLRARAGGKRAAGERRETGASDAPGSTTSQDRQLHFG
jgi:anti-sigma factor RsiW